MQILVSRPEVAVVGAGTVGAGTVGAGVVTVGATTVEIAVALPDFVQVIEYISCPVREPSVTGAESVPPVLRVKVCDVALCPGKVVDISHVSFGVAFIVQVNFSSGAI